MQFKKYCLFFFFFLVYIEVDAQVITGRILADSTNRPVIATIITNSGHQSSSNSNGEFTIATAGVGDTIKVFAVGFKMYKFPVSDLQQGNITIRLKLVSLMLKEVSIRASRDHKRDSIKNRKEFEQVFNYKPPKLTDAFTAPPSNVPFAFVNLDLGILLSAITRESDPANKLKKELIRDEQADYIRTRYNRILITRVTGLRGDSLDKFMDKYYPTIDWVKTKSDYDIIQYIKIKLTEFRKVP